MNQLLVDSKIFKFLIHNFFIYFNSIPFDIEVGFGAIKVYF